MPGEARKIPFTAAQRATIRVDFGVGKGSTGLYVALNEAF